MKIKKGKYRGVILLIILTVLVLVFGGNYYIVNMQQALWKQSVSDVLEVTTQGGHALEVYLKKDMELLKSLSKNLSQYDSQDETSILNKIRMFSGTRDSFTVIDLEHGRYYSSVSEDSGSLTPERLKEYQNLSKSGVKEPYVDADRKKKVLGYYQCFTFADGSRGVVEKGQLLSDVANEFSLSFYENRGFSYIVNQKGDILISSRHKNSNQNVSNIFDAIDAKKNEKEDMETLRQGMADGEEGVVRFQFNEEEHIFAFVPVQNTTGWYVISIIPDAVIMDQANQILKTSQSLLFLFGTAVLIFGLCTFIIWQYRKNVMEKEEEVRYREQLFSILANSTNDVFMMISTDDREVEYVSPNVERILGVSPETVKADVYALKGVVYNDGKKVDFSVLSQMEPGSSAIYETERINKITGARGWFTETIFRTTVNNDERYIIVISDRTLERKSESALREALEIAKEANASKSTFLSNMSHDIRTPMNAIVGLSALLQKDANNPEKVQEHTRKIAASSQHLLGLINDILDMSKIESGKTTLNITEINLAEIVDELGIIMRPQAEAKQQEFEISVFDIQTEHLLGDKLRINQVLINLLSNAVKYTEAGGRIEMVVRQLPQVSPKYARLRFIVKDNGIGMSEEYLEQIFQPFTREMSHLTSQIQGTGLGMAITKNLVDLMGGSISVESSLGEGSTFTVDLELRIRKQDMDHGFWKEYGVSNTLIVDDEAEICTSIISAMAGTGVAMQFALDGYSAIQMVEYAHKEGRDFDLILIDWKMEEMDGIETARRIREILPSHIPIMILTAYDWEEIEEEAYAAGINGFLQKPFFLTNFKQTIRELKKRNEEDHTQSQKDILKGKRFLAAEDNELNSEILVELLDMRGAVCEVTRNGQEVWEKFTQSEPGQYDAVLMDVQMPVMNGYEATKEIRSSSHPQAKTIPIIAMTANAFADDISDALKSGMDAHVAKPLDMERLETVLKELLDH